MNKTKETILNEVTGCGHFEPLGHYAEVHLKIEPAERNNGIIFENLCHADDLTTGNQNLVRTHIFEREHHGILTSSPITDIKITLLTGRGPVATFMDYSMEFIPLTKGKGKLNFIFYGYDTCHNEEEVIKKRDYNKNADIEYTTTSIFCSKGQAFLVKGDEAEEYMHCVK